MSSASETFFSTEDELAAPASPDSINSSRTSRKRKDRDHVVLRTPSKKLREAFNPEYEALVDQYIDDAVDPSYDEYHPKLLPSRLKGSWWTSEEKSRFFYALGRVGRLDHAKIATIVSTKTEVEISDYLTILREATADHELNARRRQGLFDVSSVKPALEIGNDCVAALDEAAGVIAHQESRRIEQKEREEHPRTWLITRHTAEWIEKCLQSGNEGMQLIANEIPIAFLLNAQTFLSLSKRIFMNSSDRESNWRTFTDSRRTSPCMMHSALSAIYALAIERTKTLVRRSLSLANLRIKAKGNGHSVRRVDVLTVIHMTGMPKNSKEVWALASRNCGLRVCENVRGRRAWGKRYTLSEVEDDLGFSGDNRGRHRHQSQSRSGRGKVADNHSEATSVDSDSDIESSGASKGSEEASSESSTSSDSSADSKSSDFAQDLTEDEFAQEMYLESADTMAGREEETLLNHLLSKAKGAHVEETMAELPGKPVPPDVTQRDLRDWTDWTKYATEWELPW